MLRNHNKDMTGAFYINFFDAETQKWKQLQKFSTLPQLSNLIVAEDQLFAVGGVCEYGVPRSPLSSTDEYSDDEDYRNYPNLYLRHMYFREPRERRERTPELHTKYVADMFRYQPGGNKWVKFPPMKNARKNLLLVYVSGYIYAIGRHKGEIVERFDMAKKEWSDVTPLPQCGAWWTSAVDFQGQLVVCGVENYNADIWGKRCRHTIAVYDSAADRWHKGLTELHQYHPDFRCHHTRPALLVQGDACYRVSYKIQEVEKKKFTFTAEVNQLELSWVPNPKVKSKIKTFAKVSIGEAVPQDRIPIDNTLGAFRIGDQVWLNVNDHILKIDVKIDDDEEDADVNLDAWKSLPMPKEDFDVEEWRRPHHYEHTNSVVLTFERKRVDIC